MGFMVLIIANVTVVNADIYELTAEQEAIITTQEGNIITFFQKAYILGTVSSGFAVLELVTFLLGIIFLLAIAKALKEVIPVFPS